MPVTAPDDQRIGQLLRTLRRHEGARQVDVALRAHVPREDVMQLEAGRAGAIPLDRIQRMFEATGGRARLIVSWNGAAADRLLDARHAALVERTVGQLAHRGWRADPEVSFAGYGERGSIDVLASNPRRQAIAVCEVKTELGSLEETNRVLDAKVRLVPGLAAARLGWRPRCLARVLILAASSTNRRVIARHAQTMASIYPGSTNDVKRWLREPTPKFSGIWFMSEVADADSAGS
jgi:hypothetical protein